MLVILPLIRVPTPYFCLKTSSGWGMACLRPREIRLEAGLTSRMVTTTSWPRVRSFLGWIILRDQLRSEMWTRPSTPFSSSTKAPKSVRLMTLPVIFWPAWYFSAMSSQGSGVSCLVPREIFSSFSLKSRTTTSISWPTWKSSDGMGDLSPGHVGDVEEALDAADVDEGPEVGQGPDLALDLLALDEVAEDPAALLLPLVLEEELPGDDGVLGLRGRT